MGTLMYINRVKHYFDERTRVLIIQSLVLSILNYCNTVWGTTNNTLLFKLQKLQNFAIRVADGTARKYDHVTPLFERLQWLDNKKSITFNTAITMFKLKNNCYPHPITTVETVSSVTGSTTRQHDCLCVASVHTQSGGRSPAHAPLPLEHSRNMYRRHRTSTHSNQSCGTIFSHIRVCVGV